MIRPVQWQDFREQLLERAKKIPRVFTNPATFPSIHNSQVYLGVLNEIDSIKGQNHD